MGDSLTAANRWQIKLNTVLGMNVTTHAKGGLGMLDIINGDNADTDPLPPLAASDVADKDLIVYFAGYNDRGTSDGHVGDVYPQNNTIAGVTQYIINKIRELLSAANNPDCLIIIMTPHCAGKYQWINKDGYDYYPSSSTQNLGTLAKTQENVAEYNGLPCLNLWGSSGIDRSNWNVYQKSDTPKNINYTEYEIDSSGKVIGTTPMRYETGSSYYQIRNGRVVLEEYTEPFPYPFNCDQVHMNDRGYDRIGELFCQFLLSI